MEGEFDLNDYEEVPRLASAASKIVADMWIVLGKPKNPFSKSGAKLMDLIISVWQDLYPKDVPLWLDERKNYKANELSIKDQIKGHTGRSLASYPYPVFQMMKVCFVGFDPGERKNAMRIVKKWPMFQMANKV